MHSQTFELKWLVIFRVWVKPSLLCVRRCFLLNKAITTFWYRSSFCERLCVQCMYVTLIIVHTIYYYRNDSFLWWHTEFGFNTKTVYSITTGRMHAQNFQSHFNFDVCHRSLKMHFTFVSETSIYGKNILLSVFLVL